MMNNGLTFSEWLRRRRRVLDLTQEELAQRVGCGVTTIRKIEGGERRPSKELATQLAVYLDIEPEEYDSFIIFARTEAYPDRPPPPTPTTRPPGASLVPGLHPPPPPDPLASRQRLDHLPDQRLFGRDETQAKLESLLLAAGRPWLIALDGLGGIGKTSLAHALAQATLPRRRFYDLAWISARQEEFLPEGVLRPVIQPALSVETFVDALLTQLDPSFILARAHEEKLAILTRWLKTQPYLVVVDNLETAVDYQSLLPLLQRLANPTKFLITSRHSLRTQGSGIHCHTLHGLSLADAAALLKYEAEIRDIPTLAQASPAQLESIYHVVGGNPLALKLVAGQLSVLPLVQVLDNLRQAGAKSVEELYIYIYWQGWEMLSEAGRQMLVAMPLAQEGSFADVSRESELDRARAGQALKELITLSLVEVGGDLEQPLYRIHRLTETFLLNEVIKWQQM
jgi:DNA-binding XRE family transcriptional regulator